jgi:hypothetical protein
MFLNGDVSFKQGGAVKKGKKECEVGNEKHVDSGVERVVKLCQYAGCTHQVMPTNRWCRKHTSIILNEMRTTNFFRPIPKTISGSEAGSHCKPTQSAIVGTISSRLRL